MEELAPFATAGFEDEAEEHLVRVLEERRSRATAQGTDKWDASVEGERPPLGGVSMEGISVFDPSQEEKDGPSPSKRIMKLARKFVKLKSEGKLSDHRSQSALETISSSNLAEKISGGSQHRRLSHNTLEKIDEETKKQQAGKGGGVFTGVGGGLSEDLDIKNTNSADRLFSAAMVVEEIFRHDDGMASVASDSEESEALDEERLPLTGTEERSLNVNKGGWFGYGSANDSEESCRERDARKKKWRSQRKKFFKSLEKSCRCNGNRFAQMFHPVRCVKSFLRFIFTSWFTKIGLPALLSACCLFYYFGNPTIDFMDQATASWWLIFLCRQTLTLELAIITQFLLIDGLALRSKLMVKVLGPLLTLLVINAKGWPFITTSWAIWDLFLLHGDDHFQQNWLYFTGISIFSPLNKGGRRILDSKTYLRILVAMAIAGLATSIKCTVVALYFGKKTFAVYKPRLEKLLADILLITEVAELASESATLSALASAGRKSIDTAVAEQKRRGMFSAAAWKSLKEFESSSATKKDGSGTDLGSSSTLPENNSLLTEPKDEAVEADLTDSDGSDRKNESDSESEGSDSGEAADNIKATAKFQATSCVISVAVSANKIKRLLDRWEEPVSKNNKTTNTSISDILKFRKALSYLDDTHPFSLLFGPAATRDECIKSAQKTYRRLLKLEPGSDTLSFDIIGLLAFDADGVEDEAKMKALKIMFRPGRFNEITVVAFVQACDSVYKHLRYFRASVGNASLIDHVLEQIIDSMFFFVLILMTLMVLNINPWPLLVSVSTLLVSFAFAIGPSLSRYIDGLLMIIVRRPYDLGDRILIAGSESVADPESVGSSWFVQDISIYTSTLRFGPTNEIATVDNGSIARSRIVNYNRSPNALVTLKLRFCLTSQEQILVFREAVESFIQDRPRQWNQLMFFRCDNIDKDMMLMEYVLRVRHNKTWQDAASILMNRSELYSFCFELGEKLGINFDPPIRSLDVRTTFAPTPNESKSGTVVIEGETPGVMSSAAKALLSQMKGITT